MMKMKCPKCGGEMNFEEFINVASEGAPWTYEGWHCVYCGEIVDSLILLNRKESRDLETVSAGKGRGKR
jgi:uncharacterized Zn finger protein